MTHITDTTVLAVDAYQHDVKPLPFEQIETIVKEAASKLFPYFVVRFDCNICHSLYIWGSLDPKESWYNGYRENSRMFASHVFCASQWYKEHPNQYFRFEQAGSLGKRIKGKMIARKDKDPVKLANYIVRQLTKLSEANKEEPTI
jgi:hypothetical protein